MNTSNQPACSVVIPTCGRRTSLRAVLDGLRAQSFEDFETIVVVDGEDVPTRELASAYVPCFPLRWIFLEHRTGAANARNVGANAAVGNLLAFLDDDTIPVPQWLATHVRAHDAANGWTRVVYGEITHSYAPPDTVIERFLRQQAQAVETDMHCTGSEMTTSACSFGVNCSIARVGFVANGGFDPRLCEINEDMEFGTRLFLAGARFVYAPQAQVEHRDSKRLSEYHVRCWAVSARDDLYRMTAKAQRTEQIVPLARLRNGSFVRRAKERWVWEHPDLAEVLAEQIAGAAERSGSAFVARLWRSIRWSVEYWREVRNAGLNEQPLMSALGAPVVTLAMHSISPLEPGDDPAYCLAPEKLQRLLKWLAGNRYACVPVGAAAAPQRTFELTFDDGYEDLYTNVFPFIERYSLRPMVFIVTGEIGGRNRWDAGRARERKLLTLGQMRELQRAGVQFGSHSVSHADLRTLSDCDLRHEVGDSKARLEDVLGLEITTFAYPYGSVDERIRAAVGEAGYRRAYTINPGHNWFGDPLLLKRAEVSGDDSLFTFAQKVRHGASLGYLLRQRIPAQWKQAIRACMPGRVFGLTHRPAGGNP